MSSNYRPIHYIKLVSRPQNVGEIILVGVAFALYFLVRGLVVERVDEAIERADRLISLEKSLGLFVEPGLQALILGRPWLVDTANAVYLYGHGPVIAVLAVFLYLRSRPTYLLMRNAFLLSGAIGLVFYYVLPVAPPRLVPEYGFVDTVFERYGVERVLMPSFVMNQYAALPSLHFGWNLLSGIGVWLAVRSPWFRLIAALMPLAMLLAIVTTANHFVLDAMLGGAIVLLALALSILLRRQTPSLSSRLNHQSMRSLVCWLGGALGRESAHGKVEDGLAR